MTATEKRALLAALRSFLGVPTHKCMPSGIAMFVERALPAGYDKEDALAVLQTECKSRRAASFASAADKELARQHRAFRCVHRAATR